MLSAYDAIRQHLDKHPKEPLPESLRQALREVVLRGRAVAVNGVEMSPWLQSLAKLENLELSAV